MNKLVRNVMVVGVVGLLAACAVPAEDAADEIVVENTLAETVAVTTADGWTADAAKPTVSGPLGNNVTGSATFTGSGVKQMGVCLLQVSTTICSGTGAVDPVTGYAGECTGLAVPTGGYRYCTAPDGGATKYCAVRPGAQANWCAGSPAMPWVDGVGNACTPSGPPSPSCHPQAIAPGTYATPTKVSSSPTRWVSYACFAGCAATDPSVSSISLSNVNCGASCPGYTGCVDIGCDGSVNSCQQGGRTVRPTSC